MYSGGMGVQNSGSIPNTHRLHQDCYPAPRCGGIIVNACLRVYHIILNTTLLLHSVCLRAYDLLLNPVQHRFHFTVFCKKDRRKPQVINPPAPCLSRGLRLRQQRTYPSLLFPILAVCWLPISYFRSLLSAGYRSWIAVTDMGQLVRPAKPPNLPPTLGGLWILDPPENP